MDATMEQKLATAALRLEAYDRAIDSYKGVGHTSVQVLELADELFRWFYHGER